MFHAKYLSSSYLGFLKEDFLSFYYIHKEENNDPWGKLGRHPLEYVSCSSYFGFLKEDFLSFYFMQIRKINDPWGGANFYQRTFI
jgi:hypothetical protein